MVAAGRLVEETVAAVDINLGCPQGIARRGFYGAYLLEEPELIVSMVSAMHQNLRVPVTCKVRKVATAPESDAYARLRSAAAAAAAGAAAAAAAEQQLDRTCQDTLLLAYALEAAGAAALTLHGRTRHEKGGDTGIADWGLVRRVKQRLNIPVIANGGVETKEDALRCLRVTGADGVMAAEGLLDDPSLFSGAASLLQQQVVQQLQPPLQPLASRLGVLPQTETSVSSPSSSSRSDGLSFSKRVELMQRYMDICRVYPPPHSGCSKAHLFRCLHPILAVNTQWRDALHQSSSMEDLWFLMDCIVQHFANENGSSSSSSSNETWYRRHRREAGEGGGQRAGDTLQAETADRCSLAAEGFESLFG
ncbi:hypothetical protein Esti_001197 [Eimeria stiedai]